MLCVPVYIYVCVRECVVVRVYTWSNGDMLTPTPATQKPPAERQRPRDARGTPGRTSDPLAVHIVPRLPRSDVCV